jgi:protein TonB
MAMEDAVFLKSDPSWQAALRSLHGVPRKRSWWIALSIAAHIGVLIAVCWPVQPVFVRPEFLARGQNGNSTPNSVALYFPKDIRSSEHPLLSLPAPSQQKPARARVRQRHNVIETEKPPAEQSIAEAGSSAGTSLYGASEGDEVKPGFAIRFTDPRVSRSQMPSGLQGDVIVELTIDINGNVIEEKLLQGLGHGIDEMVIATLRDWHFRPATRNGVAIPFKYDAHFHFPS